MNEKLAKLADSMEETARRLIQEERELLPVVGVLTKDDEVGIIGLSFGEHDQKRRAYERIRVARLQTGEGLIGLVMVNDSWMAVAPKGTRLDELTLPSEDPNRTEAVVIAVCCTDGTGEMRTLPYERKPEKTILWGERVVSIEFESNLADFKSPGGFRS